MSGHFTHRHDVEPRVKHYSPREESFPIPLKYIDVSGTAHTNLDVKQERRIDDWNIDVSRDVSDSWTGFTQFTLWKKNLQKDICGPGRDWQENSCHPGQISYGQNSGRNWERMPSWKRGKSGPVKNLNSIMLENCEEFISLTLKARNSRRPSTMLARNWKCRWLLQCLARQARIVSMMRPVAKPMSSNQNLRVSWKPVHPEDCVWRISKQSKNKSCVYSGSWIYKTAYGKFSTKLSWRPYCRKKRQFITALQFGSQIYSYASSHENSSSKSSSGQGIGNFGENFGAEPDRSQK